MPAAADDRSLLHDLLGPAAAALVASISLEELLETAPGRLAALGLGPTARRRLLASAELARRYQPACAPPLSVTSPRAVLPYLRSLRRSPTEVLGVLALDVRQAVLGAIVRVAQGSVSHVTAEPREVFSPALERRATSIVLAHNHPSGNPEPSLEDVEFTRAMCEAGVVLGIQVLDHVVVARRAYVSLRERGLLDWDKRPTSRKGAASPPL
jgi:DNA repair protein RadC